MADAWGTSWGGSWGDAWLIAAVLEITDTDILQKPVDCVLAGEQTIKDRYREWHVPQAKRTERTAVSRSRTRRIGGAAPGFTTKTGSRGYD